MVEQNGFRLAKEAARVLYCTLTAVGVRGTTKRSAKPSRRATSASSSCESGRARFRP
jgi:hypothetical protein